MQALAASGVKLVEQVGVQLARNTDARILHPQQGLARLPLRADRDRAPGRRELKRVAYQIVQHPTKFLRMQVPVHRLWRQVEDQHRTLDLGRQTVQFEPGRQVVVQVRRLLLQSLLIQIEVV